jgi:AcrR family transcriptional regulator
MTDVATEDASVDGRTARRDRNRDLVLDAVIDLFSEGTLTPSAAEVATRSGVSLRSVYRYFEDQDELVRAAIARHAERVAPLLEVSKPGVGPLDERITRFVARRMRLYEAAAPTVRATLLRAPMNRYLREQMESALAKLLGSDDCIHDACLERDVGSVLLTAGDPLDRVVRTDEPREAHGAAPARKDPELRLRQADLRRRGHDAVARRQGEFETATEREAIDRSHGRKVEVFDGAKELVHLQDPVDQLIFGILERVHELGDIGADDEAVLAARDEQALDRWLRLEEA